MKKHFVTFYSPGTMFVEQTTKEIKSWDVDKAVAMSKDITERYGATPYGFRFSTRERGPKDLDSKCTKTSPMYFLGGKIETIEDIRRKGDPSEQILLANMEGNGWNRVITTTKGWKSTQPLQENDIVLDVD